MAWNPSPKVKIARDFSNKFNKKMVIIFSIDDENQLEYASYGRDKSLCDNAKQIADDLFNYMMKGYIPFG